MALCLRPQRFEQRTEEETIETTGTNGGGGDAGVGFAAITHAPRAACTVARRPRGDFRAPLRKAGCGDGHDVGVPLHPARRHAQKPSVNCVRSVAVLDLPTVHRPGLRIVGVVPCDQHRVVECGVLRVDGLLLRHGRAPRQKGGVDERSVHEPPLRIQHLAVLAAKPDGDVAGDGLAHCALHVFRGDVDVLGRAAVRHVVQHRHGVRGVHPLRLGGTVDERHEGAQVQASARATPHQLEWGERLRAHDGLLGTERASPSTAALSHCTSIRTCPEVGRTRSTVHDALSACSPAYSIRSVPCSRHGSTMPMISAWTRECG
eukprot:1615607-Prymnesium_polylepis.2